MKRLLLILTLCLVVSYNTTAQESSEQTVISLDSDGDCVNLFKGGTGPAGRRMSAGAGI